MSRVFWDTNLFVYLLGDDVRRADHVRGMLESSYVRGDNLITSCLALGEVLVGPREDRSKALGAQAMIEEMGFSLIPFDSSCIETFRRMRGEYGIKAPDAIHLACAAAAHTDVFFTNDKDLVRKHLVVPGIHFIVHYETPIL